MKTIKSLALAAMSMAAMFGMSSCNSESTSAASLYIIGLGDLADHFNSANYWDGCYNVNEGAVNVGGFTFSHTATATEDYTSWNGFCPSRVNDTEDHKDDWMPYQWAAIGQNPNKGFFFVGNSGATVSENPLDNTTCTLQRIDNGLFQPTFVYLCNSSYTYYVAKNGNAFCPAFTNNDEFVLHIVGVRNGVMTADLELPLIKNGAYLTDWTGASLEKLGTVDKVLFYVDSTSKGVYGLNVPAYFCMTDFGYTLPEVVSVN